MYVSPDARDGCILTASGVGIMATSKATASKAGKAVKSGGASQLATSKAAKVAAALSNASKAVGAFGKSSAK